MLKIKSSLPSCISSMVSGSPQWFFSLTEAHFLTTSLPKPINLVPGKGSCRVSQVFVKEAQTALYVKELRKYFYILQNQCRQWKMLKASLLCLEHRKSHCCFLIAQGDVISIFCHQDLAAEKGRVTTSQQACW